jgi:hypothetical protein
MRDFVRPGGPAVHHRQHPPQPRTVRQREPESPVAGLQAAGNAAVASLLGPAAVQRATRAERAAAAADAKLTGLLALSSADAMQAVDAIADQAELRALMEALKTRASTADPDEIGRRLMLINRIALRQTQLAIRERVMALLGRIMKPSTGGLSAKDRADLEALLLPLSDQDLKEIEQDLILWRTYEPAGRMADTIEVVTERARKEDEDGSVLGRFSLETIEGATDTEPGTASGVAADVMDEAERFSKRPGNLCLNFVVEASQIVLGAEPKPLESAFASYAKGAHERSKKTSRGARTLGRFASELRLHGLAGPVNILRWSGRNDTGHHDPQPSELFARLSRQGAGWYFFVVNQFSYHTFVVGVRVDGGGSRKFFHIDDNGTDELDASGLDETFDRDLDPPHGRSVGSKTWQLYGAQQAPAPAG